MKKKIFLIIVIALIVIAGSILMINLVKKSTWEKQDLLKYSTSSGGGMNGGSSGTIISAYKDKALLTFYSSQWYYQDPTITEYLLSSETLNEIKEVFLNEGMYNWNRKKFTNLFVADGESTSYNFIFSDDDLSFSSQIYPYPYAGKLAKLDKIIEKYIVDGEKLPGLVLSDLSEEEQMTLRDPIDGEIKLYVYEYSQNHLRYWISNGTDTDFQLEGTYTITDESGNIISSKLDKSTYPNTIYSESCDENDIELDNRLGSGKYTLNVDALACDFEIR